MVMFLQKFCLAIFCNTQQNLAKTCKNFCPSCVLAILVILLSLHPLKIVMSPNFLDKLCCLKNFAEFFHITLLYVISLLPRWRAWAANLEDENGELRRRVGDVERRKVEKAEELEEKNKELEEENKELEEENRELRRRMEEVNKNRRIILQIIFVSILIFFVNKILKFFEIL
ncbi:hypothetical protein C2G38_2029704 [Gigaspora rosea]|uniref:BZIP domain-containing protein n=1 Tax=Gigaspora rosea TaxID=44941 RepID=A0A397VYZ3_9GLOM|nr:hypothetical protein C2G38_2029704 [Gigaspora rosea]